MNYFVKLLMYFQHVCSCITQSFTTANCRFTVCHISIAVLWSAFIKTLILKSGYRRKQKKSINLQSFVTYLVAWYNTVCNIYAVQQDTQSVLHEWVYSSRMLARHVLDLTGPSSGAFYKLYLQIWYVVIRVLLDTSSRYEVICKYSL